MDLNQIYGPWDMAGLISKINHSSIGPLPPCFAPSMKSFIKCMLRKTPEHRPSASELLKHPYLQPFVDQYLGGDEVDTSCWTTTPRVNKCFISSVFLASSELIILRDAPSWGSRSIDCFEKLEQIVEADQENHTELYGQRCSLNLLCSCGLSRYLESVQSSSSKVLKNGTKLTGMAFANLRKQTGVQEVSEPIDGKAGKQRVNRVGMLILPVIYHRSGSNPLDYVKRAKAIIDWKKNSESLSCLTA